VILDGDVYRLDWKILMHTKVFTGKAIIQMAMKKLVTSHLDTN